MCDNTLACLHLSKDNLYKKKNAKNESANFDIIYLNFYAIF